MPKGPRGEKRPQSSVSSMVRALEVATGIKEEEYADGEPRVPADESESDDDPEEYELAALEVDTPKSKKSRKKRAPKS